MKRIKTAVVGCGSISDIYMTNLTNGKFTVMELVACSDLMVERMNASAAKFGIKAMSLDEICADPEIEMVICLTTPAAHYPIIKQALLAGKHVFSEKMIAVDLWQGKELVQIANEKGLHLGVAPDTFLGASVQTAKYIVDKGLIGTIRQFFNEHPDKFDPREYLKPARANIKEHVRHKLVDVLGCAGKA